MAPEIAERLYDGETKKFNVGKLREEMVLRGMAPEDLASACGVHLGTIKNALAGWSLSTSTGAKICRALRDLPKLDVA